MEENKFSDGSASSYAELPVEAAYLKWTRGNASLKAIADADPGAYLGGWRAFVKSSKDNVELPFLPLPIVTRSSQDGKHEYDVYASNVVEFLPIAHRTRFELKEETVDPETGNKYHKVVAVSNQRTPGFTPYRQVFGLLFSPDTDEYAPAVLKVFTWSSFIAFDRAGQAWTKVKASAGKALVRRYGTIGKKGKPNFETYGQGHSTPIEAIGVDAPRFVDITPEMDELWEASQEWKMCERWNATGEVVEEATDKVKNEFFEYCMESGMSAEDIEQTLKDHSNNYVAALEALTLNEANAAAQNAFEADELEY